MALSLSASLRALVMATILLAPLSGCATKDSPDILARAEQSDLKQKIIVSGSFTLTTFSRLRDTNQPINVYIEGDVRDWTPSADPWIDARPDETIGLQLAMADPSPNVVFIAHPCQFGITDPICFYTTWVNGRYAEQIFHSINRAINHFEVSVLHPKLNLIGYSGGGAIAALLAERRYDVISLRTIAGNMDPEGTARAHAADPPEDFINPLDIAPRLANMPQEHWVGDKDVFVPPFITENFVKAVGNARCVKVVRIPDATHQTGWIDAWRQGVTRQPVCEEKDP